MKRKKKKDFRGDFIGYDFKPIPTKYISRSIKYNPSGISYSEVFGPYSNSIFLILCYHYNRKTDNCFPSEKTIAIEAGMSRNSVRKHIEPLIKYRLIKRNTRGFGQVFNYKLNHPDDWIETSEILKELGIEPVHYMNRTCSCTEQVNEEKNNAFVHNMNRACSQDEQEPVHMENTNKNMNKNNIIKSRSYFPKREEKVVQNNLTILRKSIENIKNM